MSMADSNKKKLSNLKRGSGSSRRRFLKTVLGGSLVGGGFVLPTRWIAPIVETVVLPAHAQTSPVTPRPPAITGKVVITEILWKQDVTNYPDYLDEYVEIENQDQVSIQMKDWLLTDNDISDPNHWFTFPEHIIAPGETCRIFTHQPAGSNTYPCQFTFDHPAPHVAGQYIWNNTGDTAYLYDSNGLEIDRCSYTRNASEPIHTCS